MTRIEFQTAAALDVVCFDTGTEFAPLVADVTRVYSKERLCGARSRGSRLAIQRVITGACRKRLKLVAKWKMLWLSEAIQESTRVTLLFKIVLACSSFGLGPTTVDLIIVSFVLLSVLLTVLLAWIILAVLLFVLLIELLRLLLVILS